MVSNSSHPKNPIPIQSYDFQSNPNQAFYTEAASISISSIYEINDDYLGNSIGDGDGNADSGETIELRLELENVGDTTATDVYGNLTTTNPYASISSHNQSYFQIDAGETALSVSYYLIELNSKLNVSDNVDFSLQITANEGSWSDSFSLIIIGVPDPIFFAHSVSYEYDSDLNADDDGIIDPGELVYFDLFVANEGESIFYNVDGYIETNDIYTTITDDTGVFGTIDSGDYESGYYAMDIRGDCPIGHVIQFNLSLEDNFGNFWNSTIELVVSGTPDYELADIRFFEDVGDHDGYMDAGETWYAEIMITNIGTAIGSNILVSLDSSDSNIDFYYSLENRDLSFGDLDAGFSQVKNGTYDWEFTISNRVAVGQNIDFVVIIDDDSGQPVTRIDADIQIVGVADYNITEFNFVEYCYYTEDCNGIIDAGDNLIANITIVNIGEADGADIEIFFYSSDTQISFYYENGTAYELDSLAKGATYAAYGYYEWDITISEWVKAGHEIDFTFIIRDASQRNWTFTTSIIVATGPNTVYHTPGGKAFIFGTPIAIIVFCIAPYIYKKRKSGSTISGDFKKKMNERKKEREKQKKQRDKIRKQKQKEKEAQRQQEERDRIARINANEKRMLEKFENILEMSDRVSIQQVAKSLAITEAQLFEMLIQWQDRLPFKIDGDMIEVEDSDDFSESIREQIAETVKYYSCYECGFPIERTSETCPDCKSEVDKCDLCKLPISFGDAVGKCKLCETTGHLTHMLEWVKTQGKCPVCLQKLSVKDIVQIEGESSKKI